MESLALLLRVFVILGVVMIGSLRTMVAFTSEAAIGSWVLSGPLTGLLFLALAAVFAALWWPLQRTRGYDQVHMLFYETVMGAAYLLCQGLILPK